MSPAGIVDRMVRREEQVGKREVVEVLAPDR